jgi:hypothetical protein
MKIYYDFENFMLIFLIKFISYMHKGIAKNAVPFF